MGKVAHGVKRTCAGPCAHAQKLSLGCLVNGDSLTECLWWATPFVGYTATLQQGQLEYSWLHLPKVSMTSYTQDLVQRPRTQALVL